VDVSQYFEACLQFNVQPKAMQLIECRCGCLKLMPQSVVVVLGCQAGEWSKEIIDEYRESIRSRNWIVELIDI
jgi:hypothetical protein